MCLFVRSISVPTALMHCLQESIHCLAYIFISMVEQPMTSQLFHHPSMVTAMQVTQAVSVRVKLGHFGATSAKPLQLVGTAPWLGTLAGISRRQQPVNPAWDSLVYHSDDGRVTGIHDLLKDSACYPPAFCDVVSKLHADYLESKKIPF